MKSQVLALALLPLLAVSQETTRVLPSLGPDDAPIMSIFDPQQTDATPRPAEPPLASLIPSDDAVPMPTPLTTDDAVALPSPLPTGGETSSAATPTDVASSVAGAISSVVSEAASGAASAAPTTGAAAKNGVMVGPIVAGLAVVLGL